jgi:hypothetical protein
MEQGEDMGPITRAMAEIDRLLAREPQTQGESREAFERVLIVPPLTVTFEVHEDEHVVLVLRLRYSPQR